MPKHAITLELGVDGREVPCTIEYTAHRAYRGATDGRFGPKLEPDEPAHIEIDGCTLDQDRREIGLTTEQEKYYEREIAEYLADQTEDSREYYDEDRPRRRFWTNANQDYASDLD